MDRNERPPEQPNPREAAVRDAAAACNAHATEPTPDTLHAMQAAVQKALDLGASHADIRNARGKQAPARVADRSATVAELHASADADYALGGDYRTRMDQRIKDGR